MEKLAIEWLEQKWKEYDLSLGKSGFTLFLKQAAEIEQRNICNTHRDASRVRGALGSEMAYEYYKNLKGKV